MQGDSSSLNVSNENNNNTISTASVSNESLPEICTSEIKPIQPESNQQTSTRIFKGLHPRVFMRERGKSFSKTSKIEIHVDKSTGRQILNQYTLLDELGRGAYGTVMKAKRNDTEEIFAVKIINKHKLRKVRVGRFGNALDIIKNELVIWQKLNHRHIVKLREVIDSNESEEMFMISEFVSGGLVMDNDINCTPLPIQLAKHFFCQLIEGVAYLHENNIIHRDIKPGNLLWTMADDSDEKILKLADFGVSHEIHSESESFRQTTGTAMFNAPEMLTGGEFQGKPLDIWACGVTLYMFLYGHPPFVRDSLPQLFQAIKEDEIKYPPTSNGTTIDPSGIELLQHILDKNPQSRYTAQQIRAHPWLWNEFQVSAIKCITHPQGRRSTSRKSWSMIQVSKLGSSLRDILKRPRAIVPANVSST